MLNPADLQAHVMELSHKVDQLTQGLRELHSENLTLKGIIKEGFSSHSLPPEPPISPPEYFSGDRKTFRQFYNACRMFITLKPKTFPTERVKILTIISYLRGEPRAWADSLYESNDPILESVDDFFKAMADLYEDPHKQLTAENTLRSLKQKKDM
ncbi:protein LDOC1-like [Bombina bombina]|uniref:protein LDOC1-like n=1 Tax=Bombina bombina TaxID=8345 RepID=UPI00235A49EB|nr:protein LDOC1-like [Bombina bombina]